MSATELAHDLAVVVRAAVTTQVVTGGSPNIKKADTHPPAEQTPVPRSRPPSPEQTPIPEADPHPRQRTPIGGSDPRPAEQTPCRGHHPLHADVGHPSR